MGLRGEAVEKREARRREGRWREAVEIGAVERGGGGAWLRAIDGELLYSGVLCSQRVRLLDVASVHARCGNR